MTSTELEIRWLSLRFWLRSAVLPTAAALVIALVILKSLVSHPLHLNQAAALIGFFSLYFILIRGGHLVMIRAMHNDLKSRFGDRYESKLKALPRDLRQVNLGFRLARIKRDLIQNTDSGRQ